MKKHLSALLAVALLLSMFSACGAPAAAPTESVPAAAAAQASEPAATAAPTEPAPTEPQLQELTVPPEIARYYLEVPVTGSIRSDKAIAPLNVSRRLPDVQAEGAVLPFSDLDIGPSANLAGNTTLAYSLTFSNRTAFANAPAGFAPDALMQWGMSPGLNVDILHKHGFTGKGAVIAYVDQVLSEHPAYANVNLHYTNNSHESDSMHGPTVLSILAGKETGTAPEAEVYYYGCPGVEDAAPLAEALYQIIEQNKRLSEGKKITMVGFSNNMYRNRPNEQQFTDAVAACEEAGIMVWFCGEYNLATFLPYSDRNNPANLVPDAKLGSWAPSLVFVPGAGRSTASMNQTYCYHASGGLSWTMPYMLGLYAIAIEIDPTLTADAIRALVIETAYDTNGMKLVNPVGFVVEVLRRVGRDAQAQAILDDVAARTKYLYAVVNTASMTNSDLTAIRNYLALMTDVNVLIVDAAHFGSAELLYTALQSDAAERGGEVAGVQIFGTADLVPAFILGNRVQMIDGVHDTGTFLSDLFYGNFENDPARICNNYSVMDHFAEGWEVDLIPQWPVARLLLSRGEFTAFFEKYNAFLQTTGLQRQELVNFSNPIFRQTVHTDDMGTFLNRMNKEFGILDIPYRLYGNKLGAYPVTTATAGGFTAEELAAENAAGIAEFLINSHGQWNNIDKCYFHGDTEIRESLINMNTINAVLDENPYYLNVWSCNNGEMMQNNLTTTALNGQCVGMFAATTGISGNGADCNASLSKMAQSNFYYFYYHYLKALHEGKPRGTAFFTAQAAYATALMADSANGIGFDGNYQFNLCNLLTYHNFGVLEPGFAAMPFAEFDPLVFEAEPSAVVLHNITTEKLDNGDTRFFIEYTALADMNIVVFSSQNEDLAKFFPGMTSGNREYCYFDMSQELISSLDDMFIVDFYTNSTDEFLPFSICAALENQTGAPKNLQPCRQIHQQQIYSVEPQIHSVELQQPEDGKTRFVITLTAAPGMNIEITASSGGAMYGTLATGSVQTIIFDISNKKLQAQKQGLKLRFYMDGYTLLQQLYPLKSK